MDDDQQFCLRWNNHQSTLVAVFDTLLENGTLVDCTLAAEGKCLNAHKVVLSACSPYFESLLSRHFDKHPILILKDVKFQELKAMMDYMYRGEVNISQDQLGALLKAAESLQIKGLSDNRKGEPDRKPTPAPPPPKSPQQTSALPKVQGLTIEQRSRDDSREGSLSPGPRKKKRLRRKSEELDNHDASNSSESHSLPAQNIPSSLPAVSKINADVPEPVETKSEILRHKQPDDIPQVPIIKEKIETHTELMLEPKSEYVEEMNEDSIEDLTLDDDDLSNMEQMEDQAGPSHGNAGEGSSQGFGGWHMGNQSQDEVFLAAQEAVGAHRDSQGYYTKTAKKLKLSKSQFDRTVFSDTNEEEDNVPQRSSPLTLLIGVEPGSSFHNTDQLNTSVSEVQSIFEKAYAERIMTLLLEVREQNNKILSTVSKQATNITDYLLPELPVNLPVQNEEGLNVLCEYLSCKDNVESLAKYLSSVGGSNLGNKINNILKRCLSNEVARNYNFRGRREGKRAFQDLPLKDVVIRAAKLGHPNSTENDIENCIKAWLKHAPQRYKIKEHRLEKLTKF